MSRVLVAINCCLIMNFGSTIYDLSPDGRRAVRNIENTSRKIINAKASVAFNEQCIYIYYSTWGAGFHVCIVR